MCPLFHYGEDNGWKTLISWFYSLFTSFYNCFNGQLLAPLTLAVSIIYGMLTALLFSLLHLALSPVDSANLPPQLYLSKDQGGSWQPFNQGLPEQATPANVLNHPDGIYLTTDAHGLYFLPKGSTVWEPRNNRLPQRIDINAIAADGDKLAIGTFRQGVYLSFNGGKSWTPSIFNLRAGSVRALLYHEGLLIAGTDGGIYRSHDGGMSWRHCSDLQQTNDLIAHGGRLYAARLKGIFVSEDNGASWQPCFAGNTAQRFLADGQSLYAQLIGQSMIRTTDGGTHWEIPIGMLSSKNAKTLPQKLWSGYRAELPNDSSGLRFISSSPRGWLAGRTMDGC